jgi:hypothetical protein
MGDGSLKGSGFGIRLFSYPQTNAFFASLVLLYVCLRACVRARSPSINTRGPSVVTGEPDLSRIQTIASEPRRTCWTLHLGRHDGQVDSWASRRQPAAATARAGSVMPAHARQHVPSFVLIVGASRFVIEATLFPRDMAVVCIIYWPAWAVGTVSAYWLGYFIK